MGAYEWLMNQAGDPGGVSREWAFWLAWDFLRRNWFCYVHAERSDIEHMRRAWFYPDDAFKEWEARLDADAARLKGGLEALEARLRAEGWNLDQAPTSR